MPYSDSSKDNNNISKKDIQMEITVKIKSVYGKELIYPVCDTARLLSYLTGKKTFTSEHIETIKNLGYKVTVQPEVL